MSDAPVLPDPVLAETAKCRQILDGARKVFLAQGFEGASMNDIARVAGVSKGTLYVYFENKERLFASVCDTERSEHLTRLFEFDHDNSDVAGELMRVGVKLARFLLTERVASAMRVVMGIAERMPDIGRTFYEKGPGRSRQSLAAYLDARVVAGQLDIPDTLLAASQFLEMAHSPLLKPLFFGVTTERPSDAEIERVVNSAVRLFLAGYVARS